MLERVYEGLISYSSLMLNTTGWRLGLAGLLLLAMPLQAVGATYSYVDWTSTDILKGTAKGTITLPDLSTVTVTFEAINADGSAGNLFSAQVTDANAVNYWTPQQPYISAEVQNHPPSPDILQLSGGVAQRYKVTLSEAIRDPIMAIVSLGQRGVATTYNFDSPFTIVSQGAGYWGGGDTSLTRLPDNILQGSEGHGTIRFVGTFATFSWTVPTPETWHGFTFGIRTTERLDPSSDGGADASVVRDAGPDANVVRDAAADAFGSGSGVGSDAGLRRSEDVGCSCNVSRAAKHDRLGIFLLLGTVGSFWAHRRRRLRRVL